MLKELRLASFAASALLFASCGDDRSVAGNYTSTGNSQATGRVMLPDGTPVAGAWVECRPDSIASWIPLAASWTTRTDSTGRYACTDLPAGRSGVVAQDPVTGLSHWHEIAIGDSASPPRIDTLLRPGALRVALPPGTRGTLHLSGLGRYLSIDGESVVSFDALPAGWRGTVRLATATSAFGFVDSAHTVSGKTDSAGFTRTRSHLAIPLAGASSTLREFPLLVRLDSTWDGFATTLADGSDLRAFLPDGTALPIDIVAWDREGRTGAFWTRLDSIAAPADSVRIILEHGLPIPATGTVTSFAPASGWLAAWGLGDTGTLVRDRTGSFPATASSVATTSGPIGTASLFDGRNARILVDGSQRSALDLAEDGPFTISCWARLANIGTSRYLISRGEQGWGLKFQKIWGADTNLWFARTMRDLPAKGAWCTFAAADSGRWVQLAMTVADSSVSLYVDGVRADTGSWYLDNQTSKIAVPVAIGGAVDSSGAWSQLFRGALSEMWIQSRARSADWIRQAHANQAPDAPKARVR